MSRKRSGSRRDRFDSFSSRPPGFYSQEAYENRSRIARLRDAIQNESYRKQYRRSLELVHPLRPLPRVMVRQPRVVGLRVTANFAAAKPMHRNRKEVLDCVKAKLKEMARRAIPGSGAGGSRSPRDRVRDRRRVLQAARRAC